MFLPYGTDAPVYHFPYATISIIAINAAMFIATGMGDYTDSRWLILEFDRINPLQWVTAAFMHASWIHLIGNMIFLWCLGLVVEGKLGFHRFSWLYLGLALADGAISQIPMFLLTDGTGGALGASGVIFALIAVSVIWAPYNDIHFLFVWGWFFITTVEIPIYAVALFYVALQLLQLWFTGLHMSTPMLHLLGLTIGFPFAIYMLKHNLVDCEGWDLLTRSGFSAERIRIPNAMTVVGRIIHRRKMVDPTEVSVQTVTTSSPAPGSDLPPGLSGREANGSDSEGGQRDPCATAIGAFQRTVRTSDVVQASACFGPLLRHGWASALPDATLAAYIKLLAKHGMHSESLVPLRYLVSRQSAYANGACLRIASIELKHNDDPDAAIRMLREMRPPLNDAHRQQQRKILRTARQRMDALQRGKTATVSRASQNRIHPTNQAR